MSRSSFHKSWRLAACVAGLAVIGGIACYLALPSLRASRFADNLRSGQSEYGVCETTVDGLDLHQLLSGTRTVRVTAQCGLGFKRLVFRVTPMDSKLISENVPVHEWMWGISHRYASNVLREME